MTGKIVINNKTYVFRSHDNIYLAWDIYDDYSRGMTHKWKKLPKGEITLFNIEDPPPTVSYLPIID